MIYILMLNGASAAPLFVPVLFQLLLIFFVIRYFDLRVIVCNSARYYFMFVSCFAFIVSFFSVFQSDTDLSIRLVKALVNSIFSAMAAVAMTSRYGSDFPEIYTRAIARLSLFGIVGLGLASVTDWSIVANIADRNYHTNFFTVWISDGGSNSSITYFSPFNYRLQSFFDEPGTFGILLIPALYYSMCQRQLARAFLMALSIFLTESANAWVGAVILFAYFFFKIDSKSYRIIMIAAIVSVFIVFSDSVISLYEMKMGIDDAYSNSSSYGTRAMEYGYLIKNLSSHIFPVSNMHYFYNSLPGVSSSYVQWAIYGGWLFIFVLLVGVVATGFIYVRMRRGGELSNYFPFVLAVSFYISGFQRTSVFDTVLFMSLFYWALLFIPTGKEKLIDISRY